MAEFFEKCLIKTSIIIDTLCFAAFFNFKAQKYIILLLVVEVSRLVR